MENNVHRMMNDRGIEKKILNDSINYHGSGSKEVARIDW